LPSKPVIWIRQCFVRFPGPRIRNPWITDPDPVCQLIMAPDPTWSLL